MPAPSEDDEEQGSASKRAKGSGGAVVGRWQEQPTRSSSQKELRNTPPHGAAAGVPGSGSPGQAAGGQTPKQARKPRDPSVIEVLRFMKYFHLVPAQVSSPLTSAQKARHSKASFCGISVLMHSFSCSLLN